jgi:maltooligosyltrehalose trehalohydrolase
VAEIVQRARAAADPRGIVIIAENEPQRSELLLPPEEGGFGIDAMWNDDFHHSARVALTGRHDGYFHDYRGRAQEMVSAMKYGFLFQGQHYCWQKKERGAPALDCPGRCFVAYLQNHDQVANTFYGLRLQEITSAGRLRAMTAVLLLGPHTPLLFMGQEFAASSPFAFFADHKPELAKAVWAGRKEFLRQFAQYATPEAQARILDPAAPETFHCSKLNWQERESNRAALDLHRELLRLRREDPVFSRQARETIDGAVLADRAFLIRWFDRAHGDRLLVVNVGEELELTPAPEPLLAPPSDSRWQVVMSTDEPRFGGPGATNPCQSNCWKVPAECATLLRAVSSERR